MTSFNTSNARKVPHISLSLLSTKQKIETNYKIGDFGCVVSACLNMVSVIAQSHEKMITITLNCVTSHSNDQYLL